MHESRGNPASRLRRSASGKRAGNSADVLSCYGRQGAGDAAETDLAGIGRSARVRATPPRRTLRHRRSAGCGRRHRDGPCRHRRSAGCEPRHRDGPCRHRGGAGCRATPPRRTFPHRRSAGCEPRHRRPDLSGIGGRQGAGHATETDLPASAVGRVRATPPRRTLPHRGGQGAGDARRDGPCRHRRWAGAGDAAETDLARHRAVGRVRAHATETDLAGIGGGQGARPRHRDGPCRIGGGQGGATPPRRPCRHRRVGRCGRRPPDGLFRHRRSAGASHATETTFPAFGGGQGAGHATETDFAGIGGGQGAGHAPRRTLPDRRWAGCGPRHRADLARIGGGRCEPRHRVGLAASKVTEFVLKIAFMSPSPFRRIGTRTSRRTIADEETFTHRTQSARINDVKTTLKRCINDD